MQTRDARILIVDDNPEIREIIQILLGGEGYTVEGAKDGHTALELLSEENYDLIILDIMMPGMNGYKTCVEIRKISNTPILFLSAKTQEGDKTLGFSSGGDDYLAKPFGMMELISRVNALLRRASRPSQGAAEEVAEPSDLMAVGAIKLSPSARTVVANGREVNLTRKEFDLLRTLMENKGRVLTREQLLEQVWGVSFVGETRTVDMHVKTLRRKLAEAAPGSEEAVATVRGVGYRLKKSAS